MVNDSRHFERRAQQPPPDEPPSPSAWPTHPRDCLAKRQNAEQYQQRQHDEPRKNEGQGPRLEDHLDQSGVSKGQTVTKTETAQAQHEADGVDDRRADDGHQGDEERRHRHDECPGGGLEGRTPVIELAGTGGPPHTARLPERRATIDCREHGADDTDPSTGDQIDLDTGLLQCPEDAGMIRPSRAAPGQDKRGPEVW